MINKLVVLYSILIVSLFSVTGLSMAEERYQTYEFGESDHLVLFKLSSEEITREDAANQRAELIKNSRMKKTEKWVETIELAESGKLLEFPMDSSQISLAKAKAELTLLNGKVRNESSGERSCQIVETIEMGDGNTIVFYTPLIENNHTDPGFLNAYVTITC